MKLGRIGPSVSGSLLPACGERSHRTFDAMRVRGYRSTNRLPRSGLPPLTRTLSPSRTGTGGAPPMPHNRTVAHHVLAGDRTPKKKRPRIAPRPFAHLRVDPQADAPPCQVVLMSMSLVSGRNRKPTTAV